MLRVDQDYGSWYIFYISDYFLPSSLSFFVLFFFICYLFLYNLNAKCNILKLKLFDCVPRLRA